MAANSGNMNKDGTLTLHKNNSNLGVVNTFPFHILKAEKYILKKAAMELHK